MYSHNFMGIETYTAANTATTSEIYPETEQFAHRLKRTNDPVHLLTGVYKEIVPSNKGRTTQGQYHRLIETSLGPKGLQQKLKLKNTVHADIGALAILLMTELSKHDLLHHAAKVAVYAKKTGLFSADGELSEAGQEIWESYRPSQTEESDDDFDDENEYADSFYKYS